MKRIKPFKGRKLIIATKHGKEKVIAPILEKQLGVQCCTSKNLDTDIFGTFSGETERKNNPLITARDKCLLAMEIMKCDLAIASEGSFGPHPSIFYLQADDEILMFLDKHNNLEITHREISTETNFYGATIQNEDELNTFFKKVKFPSHGLIIRTEKSDYSKIVKGISKPEILLKTFRRYINEYGSAYIETDMRAMYNPTRMKVIESATNKLAEKINTFCPECYTPGFSVTNVKFGLACSLCNYPTQSTLSHIFTCQKCLYNKEQKYPHGKIYEDPMYCDRCNP